MKKVLGLLVCAAIFAQGCSKDTPEPVTPATAQASTPPAPTAPRPDPVGATGSTVLPGTLAATRLQMRVWTDDGLREIEPGAIVALPQGTKMVIHLYPHPEAQNITFNGPMRIGSQGGFAVLELQPDTPRGVYDVKVKSGVAPEFPLQVEVR